MLHEYLKENILITDGAMGTYYSQVTGDTVSFCEFANIDQPEIIKKIHREYIEAGAKLIRTNTFSANPIVLGVSREKVKEVLVSGFKIAKDVAKGKDVFVAASIGPIREPNLNDEQINVLDEYKFIVDTFIEIGTELFVFETFSNFNYLEDISLYIKQKNSAAFILTQFAVTPDGFTRDGISANRIARELKAMKSIDAYGFNCGSGPTHLYRSIKKIDLSGSIVSVLPNAGYPELINERTVYVNNPDYFAEKMEDFKNLGALILGGCCGTTPAHIRKLADMLEVKKGERQITLQTEKSNIEVLTKEKNDFLDKLQKNQFVVAVELAPPFDTSIEKIMHGAMVCKENGVDLITVPDSPMSKVRADAAMIAGKIKREIGIDVMPHLCCRDKNVNAIRSGLLASHIDGIRNVLAITGDPISDTDKIGIKNVFNLNSFRLIELLSDMNKEAFMTDNINIGGALNLNVLNKEVELSRMLKKIEKGANFFLTQPIYEDNAIEFLIKVKKEYDVKILGGILPIVNYKNAQFLNNELPGVNIPQCYVDRFHLDMSKEEAEEVGINLAVEIANKFKNYVDGFYLMTPFKRVEMIMKILSKVSC